MGRGPGRVQAPCVRGAAGGSGGPGASRVLLTSWGLGRAERPPAGKQGLRRPLSPARGMRPPPGQARPCSS